LDPIADLIDPRSIYVEAAVPVDQLAKLRPGMSALITSPLRPGVRFTARVGAVAPNFSPGGATLPVRIEFVGADRLAQSGAPVEAAIVIADFPDAVTVPDTALFEDASTGAHYVFVAGDDGLAHRTPVTLGIQSDGRTQIIAGVAPGTIVITSGGYALSDGLRVKVAVATP
jgi:multidrug efflux system membrane fusion protein